MEGSNFVQFSKPFIDACKKVFEMMVNTELRTGKPELKQDNKSQGDITSTMGISGTVERDGHLHDFQGLLCISFPESTYLKIAGSMFGTEYTEIDDEIADVGNEISNIITGNAKKDLNEFGYKIAMSIPSMITGKGHKISYPKNTLTINIPIECDHGRFFMEICYQDQLA